MSVTRPIVPAGVPGGKLAAASPCDDRRVDHGRRSVPHIADLRIEAWGRSREECVAQVVLGLVESFADTRGVQPACSATARLSAPDDPGLVAAAVDEVIYLLDAHGMLALDAAAARTQDGGIELTWRLASVETVEITGAAPKAAALSGLTCAPDAAGVWHAAVTVDV